MNEVETVLSVPKVPPFNSDTGDALTGVPSWAG